MNVVARALSLVLITPIRLYQRFISPMRPPTCRFFPSCSAYAVDALRTHGPFVGLWLAIRRIGRCHPWTPGGVDHVPPAGQWRSVRPPYDPGDLATTGPADSPAESGQREGETQTGGEAEGTDDAASATRSSQRERRASSLTLWRAWHRGMSSPCACLPRDLARRSTIALGA